MEQIPVGHRDPAGISIRSWPRTSRLQVPAHTRVPGCAHTWGGTRVFTRVRGGDCHQVSLSARPPPPTASPSSSSSSSPAIFVLPAAPAVGIKGFSSNLDVSFQKSVHTFPWHLQRGKKKSIEKDKTTQKTPWRCWRPRMGDGGGVGVGFWGEGWGCETPGITHPMASCIFHPLGSRCRILRARVGFWLAAQARMGFGGPGWGGIPWAWCGGGMAEGWHIPCAMGPPGRVPSHWQLD